VPLAPEDGQSLSAGLGRVDAVLEELGMTRSVTPQPRDRARDNAMALLEACGSAAAGRELALVGYAAELLSAVDLAVDAQRTRELVGALQARAGIPRVALGRELLRTRRAGDHAASHGLEAQLALLRTLTGARAVSVWSEDSDGEPRAVARAGELDTGAVAAVAAARAMLAGEPLSAEAPRDTLGTRIDPARPAAGALIAHGIDPAAPELRPLLSAAAPNVAELLERDMLLDRQQWRELVAGAVERRLARVRFDLHDGPQQDVILLAHDVRLFRDQLRPLLDGDPNQQRALGRLDDLEAQLIALDGDLRRLSTSVQSPFLAPDSLLESLQRVTDAFAKRTGIRPEADYRGDLTQLSESQQIALLALIQEALSNVRKHSEATSVQISIVSDSDGIRVTVSDDGRGFDPETTVAPAARAGRLGLVGMHERVRMLGGQTRIESRPGGPTVICAVLPWWGGDD
jgi:signal transduction histidine kinase